MASRLDGKVAIVTGAGATGNEEFASIGQAISVLLAREGAKVLLVDLDEKSAGITLAQIKEEGGEASVFLGDVTSSDDCRGIAEQAVSRYGKLNVLVNNVGISGPGLVTEVDEDLWDTVIDVNLKSVMLTSKHAIPPMVKQGGGSIINPVLHCGPAGRQWQRQPSLRRFQRRDHRAEQLHGGPLRP
jgi:NAD(P)-dependent dehydrogenase (short-subunit alcohol dehydrogenase family)